MRRPIKKPNQVQPDLVYKSLKVAQFINHIMQDGKKDIARKVVYDALDEVKKLEKDQEPLDVFETALQNVGPSMEVRSRRIGGANYQVPREVRPERRAFLAMTWIIQAARKRTGAPMYKFLAEEIVNAFKEEGEAVKKKENTHKMAEANKAFAHFAW